MRPRPDAMIEIEIEAEATKSEEATWASRP